MPKMPAEYHKRYNIAYNARPEVKQKRAEEARLRRLDPDETPKQRARRATRTAVRAGRLVKSPCFCGDLRVDAHHEDYSRPLGVVWLCKLHHRALHLEKVEA